MEVQVKRYMGAGVVTVTGLFTKYTVKVAGGVKGARRAGVVLWAHRRHMHRIAWRAVPLLWTVRAVFPWTLRVLVIIGAIQIPVLPFDEIAAGIALIWIVARYRPLARVIWRAAVLEVYGN